jgi:hypothetical protein
MQNFQVLPQKQTDIFLEAPNTVEEVIQILKYNLLKILSFLLPVLRQ